MIRAAAAALAASSLLAVSANAHADFGDLDTSFGTGGLATVDFSTDGDDRIRALFVDGEDRIYALAHHTGQHVVLRFTPDGDMDTTFSTDGQLELEETGYGLTHFALDGQGRFLAAVVFGGVKVFRFDTDGMLDDTFGTNGMAEFTSTIAEPITSIGNIEARSDGKIVVGTSRDSDSFGSNCFYPVRFTIDGDPDPTLDGDGGGAYGCSTGYLNTLIGASATGPQGRMLLGGWAGGNGNRHPVIAMATDTGTYDVTIRSVGYGNGTEEATFVAMRHLSGQLSLLAHKLTGGKPSGFYAAKGSGVTQYSGTLVDGMTEDTAVVTMPAAWIGAGSYALQSDGAVLLGGLVDDGAGNTDAAVIRFEGAPQLAVPSPDGNGDGGGGGGGGSLPLLLLALLGLGALARRSR